MAFVHGMRLRSCLTFKPQLLSRLGPPQSGPLLDFLGVAPSADWQLAAIEDVVLPTGRK
jgi:hypothetical protein